MTETFTSQKLMFAVDIIEPAQGRHPAVIFLHGTDGFSSSSQPNSYLANFLAERGYSVIAVHYLYPTDHIANGPESLQTNLVRWCRTISDAVSFASHRPNVWPGRIALLGVSLGATLALLLGGRLDRVRAVVTFCGTLPAPLRGLIDTMPPTLILHGLKDKKVPIGEAYSLEMWLRRNKYPYQMKVYCSEGHIFSSDAAQDASQVAFEFLDQYVANPEA